MRPGGSRLRADGGVAMPVVLFAVAVAITVGYDLLTTRRPEWGSVMAGSGERAGFPVVDLPPAADGPEATVRLLVAELVRAGQLPGGAADEVIRRVWQRERLGSTAIGQGVAIPHARSRTAAGAVGVVGRCPRPFDWPGALDGASVGVVCLVVTPDGPGLFIRELEQVVRALRAGPGQDA